MYSENRVEELEIRLQHARKRLGLIDERGDASDVSAAVDAVGGDTEQLPGAEDFRRWRWITRVNASRCWKLLCARHRQVCSSETGETMLRLPSSAQLNCAAKWPPARRRFQMSKRNRQPLQNASAGNASV
ncbi:hypothetical protein [Sulfitobacter guttiformis]|uniref:hypothetical protein n=1 Tax=Sulfitobacter guttiformis TaxID=74349 RepID=UPI000468757C|nr:hypothetical protein [Sulfitobacter guttiformis]